MIDTPRGEKPAGNMTPGLGARGIGLGGLARLRQIVLTAVIAGLVGGALLTGLQRIAVVPIILEAETYESASGGVPAHSHDAASADTDGATIAPAPGVASPTDAAVENEESGASRLWLTLVANLVSAAGFGLLLAAGMSLVAAMGRRIDWKKGLLWGLAGFGAFQLAPALGLPPEIPGAAAAELGARQGWWVLTVILTGIGFAWLAFAPRHWLKLLAVAPLIVPHLIGAPEPEHHGGLAPDSLATQFVYAALITNGLFWLALGGAAGYAHSRFERREIAAR